MGAMKIYGDLISGNCLKVKYVPNYPARATMRILLFLATNAAILVVITIVFQIFGFEGTLLENGVDLD